MRALTEQVLDNVLGLRHVDALRVQFAQYAQLASLRRRESGLGGGCVCACARERGNPKTRNRKTHVLFATVAPVALWRVHFFVSLLVVMMMLMRVCACVVG